MDEQEIVRMIQCKSADETEFREELLQRCLAVLGQDDCVPLNDSELNLLAAAGNPAAAFNPPAPRSMPIGED